jgi:hypothetical protein
MRVQGGCRVETAGRVGMCVQQERRLETVGHVGKIEHLYPSVQRREEPLAQPAMQRVDLEVDKYVLLMPRSRKQVRTLRSTSFNHQTFDDLR